ncbi:DUF5134 domain-containing protein [Yinghuangia sp. ASG 101]|uniref:DUF5134 domain-containing protein n=1 Tax=Yinghuangia sp. ASG 101 TaxID=2896848 RepID=UPI001E29BB49|nr:DUF5134 domain-containing protein [Yinghuangia sp. ASG 101]UGQ10392.1 DUF5134 domain-containing protein [Yinghuangia sp. ASG 101]
MDAQLLAAELGVVAGLVGACVHRRDGAGAWSPHLVMGGAMGAMALPEHDPLGPGGWMLLLGCAAAWAWGRPGRGRERAAVALDLYVMGVATLLMPAVHGGGHGSGTAHHAAGEPASGWWSGPYAALLVAWALARVTLAAAEHRRRAVADRGCDAEDAGSPALGAAGGTVVLRRGAAKGSVPSVCSMVMIGAMGMMAFAP